MVVGPLVQTMVERHWQTEMFCLWGVHFYRWCALPLVMPPSASCNARHTPGTRQAHAYNATMAPWNLSHGLLAPLSCSLGFPMVPSGAPSLYYAPSDVSWPYDPCNPYPMSYNHLVGIRMPYFTLTSH